MLCDYRWLTVVSLEGIHGAEPFPLAVANYKALSRRQCSHDSSYNKEYRGYLKV
jgi:hypothetical protein